MAEYKKASELDPKEAAAHNGLGNILADLGRRDEAMAEFKKSSKLDPKYATLHCRLGSLLGDLGRRDEAKAELKKASQPDPQKCRPSLQPWQHSGRSGAARRGDARIQK